MVLIRSTFPEEEFSKGTGDIPIYDESGDIVEWESGRTGRTRAARGSEGGGIGQALDLGLGGLGGRGRGIGPGDWSNIKLPMPPMPGGGFGGGDSGGEVNDDGESGGGSDINPLDYPQEKGIIVTETIARNQVETNASSWDDEVILVTITESESWSSDYAITPISGDTTRVTGVKTYTYSRTHSHKPRLNVSFVSPINYDSHYSKWHYKNDKGLGSDRFGYFSPSNPPLEEGEPMFKWNFNKAQYEANLYAPVTFWATAFRDWTLTSNIQAALQYAQHTNFIDVRTINRESFSSRNINGVDYPESKRFSSNKQITHIFDRFGNLLYKRRPSKPTKRIPDMNEECCGINRRIWELLGGDKFPMRFPKNITVDPDSSSERVEV
ncbi:hypothetical protein, partial [Vibrio sp.]|uniref:hypothetical protein n=1 Tax=Vibrio sp. TaxID=678 RepID=UPI003D0C6942